MNKLIVKGEIMENKITVNDDPKNVWELELSPNAIKSLEKYGAAGITIGEKNKTWVISGSLKGGRIWVEHIFPANNTAPATIPKESKVPYNEDENNDGA